MLLRAAIMPTAGQIITLTLYFLSGIALTCYNKWLISPAFYHFSFPVTLIFIHMCINFTLAWVTTRCSTFLLPPTHELSHSKNLDSITWQTFLRRFAPIGILFGADICLTNISFRYVSVSLTEIIKSGTPAILMIYSVVNEKDAHSDNDKNLQLPLVLRYRRAFRVITFLTLTAGIALTSLGEIDFDLRGFVSAVGATIAGSCKLILTEQLLKMDESALYSSASINKTSNDADKSSCKQYNFNEVNSEQHTLLNKSSVNHSDSIQAVSSEKELEIIHHNDSISSTLNSSFESCDTINESVTTTPMLSPRVHAIRQSPQLVKPENPATHGRTSPTSSLPTREKINPIQSLLYFSPVSITLLFPLFLFTERSDLIASSFITDDQQFTTVTMLILLGSLLAFGLNCSELFVIQYTSALTLCVLATVKFLFVIVITTYLFHHPLSPLNAIGCAVSVAGVAMYNCQKCFEIGCSSNAAYALVNGTDLDEDEITISKHTL